MHRPNTQVHSPPSNWRLSAVRIGRKLLNSWSENKVPVVYVRFGEESIRAGGGK